VRLLEIILNFRLSIPYSWVKFTQNNIARSQRERAASERLRGEIDACLRACANAMWSQFNAVNNAFNSRVRETTDARDKLQGHLQRVNILFGLCLLFPLFFLCDIMAPPGSCEILVKAQD